MLLSSVKTALRVTANAFDGEIQDLIDAAKADLIVSGVSTSKVNDETDSLIRRAVTIYCKANFGWNNPDAERLQKSYEMLKNHLSLAGDYREPTVGVV